MTVYGSLWSLLDVTGRTYGAGIDDRTRYLVMEYVAGAQTLDVHCHTDGLLPIERVVSLMLTCALAFDYAHTKGVVHRDIKPKNILLNADSEIKVGDFGVALIDRSDVEETQVMGTLGSPRYMAPEQIMGGNVTNQSDIFPKKLPLVGPLVEQTPPTSRVDVDWQRRVVDSVPHSKWRPDRCTACRSAPCCRTAPPAFERSP